MHLTQSSALSLSSLEPSSKVRALEGHVIYLPIVFDGGDAFTMGTDGLSKGQAYYIAIELDDGYNVSRWYSEVPVRVR